VDGGQSQVGIESTVIDLTTTPPRVLRPGMIHEESLRAVLGPLQSAGREAPSEGALHSPGLLRKHYAPRAKLAILSWRNTEDFNRQLSTISHLPSRIHVIAHTHIPSGDGLGSVSVIPHDAEAFARAIYAELHRCDETGAALIVVEALPEGVEWQAIADRLNRAVAD
jgi:L-threonylcarbamoyladenylate synthase